MSNESENEKEDRSEWGVQRWTQHAREAWIYDNDYHPNSDEGLDFVNANLEGANLEKVFLEGASMNNANLKGANMIGAYLECVTLRDADLSGANLSNVRGGNAVKQYYYSYHIQYLQLVDG